MVLKSWPPHRIALVIFCLIFLLINSPCGFASSGDHQTDYEKTDIPEIQIIRGVVKNGDTASSLLDNYLPLKQIYEISNKKTDGYSLSRIRKGRPYKLIVKGDDLVRFEYEVDMQDRLIVRRTHDDFSLSLEPIEYDTQQETVSSVITSSLFSAVRQAGEQSELAIQLADIFAWDIDFIRDIRPGDHFKVLVEKRYRNGKFCGYGQIQAAFFTSRETVFKAFLFEDSEGVSGYYDENGQSLQKTFLKAPLSFSRISSRFTKKRMHPIFKEYRPHRGVDYAAPTGTPIKTVGDGVIIRKGYNKGMGNFIEIRHNNGYITGYNHMSRFARGMKINKRLVQGDVIGYVGMTGYATGPHLDFRMRKNGVLIDPLKYKAPSANPVKEADMDLFLATTQKMSSIILTAETRIFPAKKPT